MSIVSLVCAMTRNRVIGRENQMPWHLPADLAHFKRVTLGKPVVMGRRTFESIGRPLPGRHNIVLTRDHTFSAPGASVVHSLDDAIQLAGEAEEIMIIGGANLYAQALPISERMYLTLIEAELEGDAYFPTWSTDDWEIETETFRPADEKNAFNLRFLNLVRKRA
ncbi:MAG: type 3 dihydrofolate reductase [Gammaproteobacteria bacterium]|nr:MAG: type 3 dihydrofolate reductase [Gammaproteobacteria bacterium]